MRRTLSLCAIIFAVSVPALLRGEEVRPDAETVAVFIIPQAGMQLSAVAEISQRRVIEAFEQCGRFIPADTGRTAAAAQKIAEQSPDEEYLKAAGELGAGICAVIGFRMTGNICFANMKIIPAHERFGSLKKNVTVKSAVLMNIPLKLAGEILILHKNIPVSATIIKKEGGTCLISAGQWHGLAAGEYHTGLNEPVKILKTERYTSIAELPGAGKEGGTIIIRTYPDVKKISVSLEQKIEQNILYKYGLQYTSLRSVDAGKQFITGICVINTGASFCAPGYGSYLSTEYLGITPGEPSIAGISLTCASVFAQLTLPEFMTGFSVNFFPWVKDRDKTAGMQNLQIFLWASLPFTFSASYLDQLANQFSEKKHLPPFFENKNEAAAALSLFIPGGGLFYKGYRAFGWAYYFTEMAAAACGIYCRDRNAGGYAFAALGILKIADIVSAYFIRPSYAFYRFEKENAASFSFGIREGFDRDCIYSMSASLSF